MSLQIYVDIDDVLACTIESLVALLHERHGRRVAVEDVEHFDLERSFRLDADEIQTFMDVAHSDPVLESLDPIEGAASALAGWRASGHTIHLVTGRPPATHAASRRWLDRHSIAHDDLHHLDKWARPTWNESNLPAIGFEDLPRFEFSFAVEDSLDTAVRLVEQFDIAVALMDRPWNRDLDSVSKETRKRLRRCCGWSEVASVFADRFR